MKKKYNKPVVLIENFELNQHIATGCNLIVKEQPGGGAFIFPDDNQGVHGLDFGVLSGMKLFNEGIKGCDVPVDQYCYHNSISEKYIFGGTHTSF